MQALTILTTLRAEIAEAEHTAAQAWEQYARAISDETLAQAVEAAWQVVALHRQLANRLEQLIGGPTPEDETPRAPLTTCLTALAA